MNLQDRTEIYNERIQNGNSKFLASYQSGRHYIFAKTYFFDVLHKLVEQDYKVIANETDNKTLAKRAIVGALEFASSYGVLLGSPVIGLVTKNPELMLSSGLLGLLLNWDGEFKIANTHKRCEELGVRPIDLIDNYLNIK